MLSVFSCLLLTATATATVLCGDGLCPAESGCCPSIAGYLCFDPDRHTCALEPVAGYYVLCNRDKHHVCRDICYNPDVYQCHLGQLYIRQDTFNRDDGTGSIARPGQDLGAVMSNVATSIRQAFEDMPAPDLEQYTPSGASLDDNVCLTVECPPGFACCQTADQRAFGGAICFDIRLYSCEDAMLVPRSASSAPLDTADVGANAGGRDPLSGGEGDEQESEDTSGEKSSPETSSQTSSEGTSSEDAIDYTGGGGGGGRAGTPSSQMLSSPPVVTSCAALLCPARDSCCLDKELGPVCFNPDTHVCSTLDGSEPSSPQYMACPVHAPRACNDFCYSAREFECVMPADPATEPFLMPRRNAHNDDL